MARLRKKPAQIFAVSCFHVSGVCVVVRSLGNCEEVVFLPRSKLMAPLGRGAVHQLSDSPGLPTGVAEYCRSNMWITSFHIAAGAAGVPTGGRSLPPAVQSPISPAKSKAVDREHLLAGKG